MRYLLFRLPVLPEDEGRKFYIGERSTRAEIEELRDEVKGTFFFSGDYEILEVTDR